MTALRRPLTSVAALIVFLTIHIGACGAHYHTHGSARKDAAPVAETGCRVSADGPAEDDDDHPCPICNVLHLAKALPIVLALTAVVGHTGEAAASALLSLPHPLETVIHSRGPPAA